MDAGVSGTPSPVGGTPTRIVTSPDGTRIAVFTSGDGPPIVLVHGAAADHTTFRVIGPRLAERYTVHAIDRRGRGGSGDTLPYAIEREYADIAAVVGAIGDHAPAGVPVIGHSYGGRCALGAALLTHAVAAVVCYEGAPTPPGVEYGDAALADELAALDDAGRPAELLETFLRRVVGMDDAATCRISRRPRSGRCGSPQPTPSRASYAPRGAPAPQGSMRWRASASRSSRCSAATANMGSPTRRLRSTTGSRTASIVVIPGARHAAHHTHPDALIEAIETFLGGARGDPNAPTMGYSDRA